MTEITFYGGIGEIGGNKILIETDSGNILFDFGRRMGVTGSYYSEFLQIRSKNALRDLLRLGVLPKINGIYDEKYLDTTILLEHPRLKSKLPLDKAPDYWTTNELEPYNADNPFIDAVFISHAHFDHIQDVSFLDPRIPLISTSETETISKTICDLSASSIDQQFYELRRPSYITTKNDNYRTLFPGELEYKDEKEESTPQILDEKTGYTFCKDYECDTRIYRTDLEGEIKGIKYKLIPVGHSIPGACSVLITTPDQKRILYSGDLRFHGASGVDKTEYVQQVGGPIDYLLIEGTRVKSQNILTEHDISNEIERDVSNTKGLVLIDFGYKDLSRFNVIYQVSKNTNRTFVISPKLAYLLYEMHCKLPDQYDDPRVMPNLRVYLKREKSLLYSKADYAKFKMGYLHHHGRNSRKSDLNIVRIAEKLGVGGDPANISNPLPDHIPGTHYEFEEVYNLATHHLTNGIKAYEIRENPEKFVLMFGYWDCNELFDLIPENTAHYTRYIRASTEPFNDEMALDERKFVNWLNHFDIDFEHTVNEKGEKIFTVRHVSGHLSQPEIVELVNMLNPKFIIPIHTTHPEIFEQLFGNRIFKIDSEKTKTLL